VLIQDFLKPDRQRLEIPGGEAPVGGEALREDEQAPQVLDPLPLLEGDEPADVDQAVLLGADEASVGQRKGLPGNLADGPLAVPRLAEFDEEGVFGDRYPVRSVATRSNFSKLREPA
jgi:hypothetical protein